MRRLTIGQFTVFIGGIVGALAILGFLLSSAPSAQAADIGFVGIDTDVSGNIVTACTTVNHPSTGYPCNDSTVLGTLQTCLELTTAAGPNHSKQIDIIGQSIPAGGASGSSLSMAGAGQSDMALQWAPSPFNGNGPGSSNIAVSAATFAGIALIRQAPGGTYPGSSSVADETDSGGMSGNWVWSDPDVNGNAAGEGGDGIAVRLTITGELAGSTTLNLALNGLGSATWTDIFGNEYSVGTYGTALVVVDGSCPTTPTPTPSPSPTPSPTPAPTNSPTPSPVPTPSPTPIFAPFYTITIDQDDSPNEAIFIPTDDNCKTNLNTNPYPLMGIPCEMYEHTSEAPGTDWGPELYTVMPQPAIQISPGWVGSPALSVPNGMQIGALGFSTGLAVFSCGALGPAYPTVPLVDAALPDFTTALLDDGSTPGWTNSPTPYAPEGTEINGPAALYDPLHWPTNLEYDAVSNSSHTGGAVLIARYYGLAPIGSVANPTGIPTTLPGTPINILVFNLGTSYLTRTILGNPGVPTSPASFAPYCTPYTTDVDFFGASPASTCVLGDPNGCTPNPSTTFPATFVLRQCNVGGQHTVYSYFLDGRTLFITGQAASTYLRSDTINCQGPQVSMTKDEAVGDNSPPGDIVSAGITASRIVMVSVPGPATLHMSIVGPAVCNPHFTSPNDPFPSVFGTNQTSTATISGADGNVAVAYSVNCPQGDFCFQIVANVDAAPGNGNVGSQAENLVCVHVGPPPPPPPPTTNISVEVQKEETYNVNTSENTPKNVTIIVHNNGTVAADVVVHVTAISSSLVFDANGNIIGGCQVRVLLSPTNPAGIWSVGNPNGQKYTEYFTDEKPAGAPDGIIDTFTSQVQFTIPAMAANSSQTFAYQYSIHCFERSSHTDAFELQIDALPLAPVLESNLGTAQYPCGTPGHNPLTDNVHKNCPDVTSFDHTDIQKTACTLSPGLASNAVGDNFQITNTCTITNAGPTTPVAISDSSTLTLPSDCHLVGSAATQVATATVAVGTPMPVSHVWVVSCDNPSNHTFTANDTVTVTTLHVTDTNTSNNTGTASTVVAITTTIDVVVSNVAPNCPASNAAGVDFICSVFGTVSGLGANTGTAVFTLSGPADCTLTAAGGQTQPAANGLLGANWTVNCAEGSNHTFTGTLTVTVTTLHVSDSNTANNTGNGNTTVAVIAACNLTTALSGLAAQTDLTSGKTANLSATATINGGPAHCHVSWTVAVFGDATVGVNNVACIVTQPSPNAGSGTVPPSTGGTYAFTATIPAGDIHECGYHVTLQATADGLHQTGFSQITVTGVVESNVIVAKYCLAVGPAAVNLSDSNGRYEFDICEIGNVTDDAETVTISQTVTPDVPTGCTRVQNLILPGASSFVLAAHEQKILVYRVRYECHDPATAQVITQTVTFTVVHVPDVGNPAGDVETFTSDNTKVTTKQVMIQ